MGEEKSDLSLEAEKILIEMCKIQTTHPINKYSKELVDKGLAKYVDDSVEATTKGFNYYRSKMEKPIEHLTVKEINETLETIALVN